ncbi:hypothetical protein [Caloranaerobacter sp. DY30410]|uniref:hypothetical protein n=1 Tax=Caloranaerobacter sp. DY30410 TaxID=3238305 RepID=UPI003CFBFE28
MKVKTVIEIIIDIMKFSVFFIMTFIIYLIAYAILVKFLSIFPKWLDFSISLLICIIGWKLADKKWET